MATAYSDSRNKFTTAGPGVPVPQPPPASAPVAPIPTGGGTPVTATGTKGTSPKAGPASPVLPPPTPEGPGFVPPTLMPRPTPEGPGFVTPSNPAYQTPGVTQFGPGNDLVGAQIAPALDPRLAATQGRVDTAVAGLAGGPDRTQLGQQAFADFLAQGGTEFDRRIREITQRNAAGGRAPSGMYGSDLVDATTAFNRDAQYEANRLASNLANATRDDQFRQVGVLSGLEGQQYDQGLSGRNELRGERGYQYGLSQDAIKNAERQRLIEEELVNSGFGRDEKRIDDLIRIGYMNNPAGLYLGASGDVASGANQSGADISALLAQYFSSQRPSA